MTSTETILTIPEIEKTERALRLIEAGRFWGDRITKDVANAALTYTVSGKGLGSVGTELRAGKHVFHIDEPTALAGDDAAASPVEVALGAFIACQIVVYRLYAQLLGIPIDSIEVTAEGDLDVRGLFGMDKSIRPGFSSIRLTVVIQGPETAEKYADLQQVVDQNCPILDLFANRTPITVAVISNNTN